MDTMMGQLRQLVSTAFARARLASQAGLSFNGKRDMYSALGYDRDITVEMYRDRYRRGGIAGRIIDAKPKATWFGEPEIIEDDDPEITTPFEEQVTDLVNRLDLWSTFQRVDVLSGIGRYGVLLMGLPGKFDEPFVKGSLDDLLYITPWSEEDAQIVEWNDDASDPRFGQPNTYNFKRTAGNAARAPKRVHWSRVIHVADDVLDEQVLGLPRLERVWNKLDDLDKMTGAGAEAFWLNSNPGYQVNIDKDTVMEVGDQTALQEEMDEFIHNFRRFIRTRGADVSILGASVASFAGDADAIITQISGSTEIPKRILVGSERAHLASTQDRTNWHERIQARRKRFAEPVLIRQFFDRLVSWGMLADVDYIIAWPVLQDLDSKEQATVAQQLASLGSNIITEAEIRDRVLHLNPLEGEEQEPEAEADDDKPQPPVPPKALKVFKDVDEVPKSKPWKDVHAAADNNRALFAGAIKVGVKAARKLFKVREIAVAIEARDEEWFENYAILTARAIEEEISKTIPALIVRTMASAGRNATATAKTKGDLTTAKIVLSFNVTNPEAVAYANAQSAALVTGVTKTTKKAIAKAVAIGLDEGLPVATTATAIQGMVGLTPRDSAALVKASKVLSRTQIARLADRMLSRRAKTIARTETIAAANEGQRQLWKQAERNGLLTGLESREWIVTDDDRLCEICEPMDAQLRGLDEPFETGDGNSVMGPPAHPDCRCAVGLTERKRA